MSRTYGKAQDLIDFTRASSGTALRRVKYGAELVTNGTFDSDVSGWSSIGSISVVGQQLYWTNTNIGGAYTTIATEAGKVYRFTFDLTVGSGSIRFSPRSETLSGTQLASIYLSTGSNTIDVVADGSAIVLYIQNLTATEGEFYLDNVSAKETIFDTSDGDLVLFNHPNNIPRIEYDAQGNVLGLLVEESRTNLITYSEDFTQWSAGSGATISSGAFTSPDGLLSGTEVTSGGVGSDVFKSVSLSATTYAFSIWVRNTDLDVQIRIEGSGGLDHRLIVNNGVISSEIAIDSSGVTTYPNGLVRAYCVFTVTTAETKVISIQQNTGSMGLWGAQVEAGSFPTSYIPTSGSTATRSADVASLSTSAFGYNQDGFSIVVEAKPANSTAAHSAFDMSENLGGGAERCQIRTSGGIYVFYSGTDANGPFTTSGGAISGGSVDYNFYKAAVRMQENNTTFTVNGTQIGTDTSVLVPDLGVIKLGFYGSSVEMLNGHIKSLKYYPRRLTNAQLQELTS